MRVPSERIAVDANIILSAAFGQRSSAAFENALRQRVLLTTRQVAVEVEHVVASARFATGEALEIVAELMSELALFDVDMSSSATKRAQTMLQHGPASGNGTVDDAHLLVAAWDQQADIWTHDRDFIGLGWPVWSTRNLADALARH